ncbi:MAG: HAD family hydrolase [Candidatus Zambryskibacteria bacterium RIFCSPHIGHO2_12_FULL_44_12b]|nr:MAG: HAD family hydrolase [Candidatus Zambryskibacteria bacterium RIFCSPHIGHO2_12_FULL_44_12b]
MSKKLIAFDLDDTLAESKSAITDRMSELLGLLLEKFEVCVISGGKFEQFEKQLLSNLNVEPSKFRRLHIMPTCGTRYYRFDKNAWRQIYAEDFTAAQKAKIIKALELAARQLGYMEKKPWGEITEDRGSQITFSALGQKAPVEAKEKWDPTGKKKQKIRNLVAELIPQFEVRTGGKTSIDVTKLGIDKAYGMQKLLDMSSIKKEDVLFFGDKLMEGGNDYPIKAMGIHSIEVSNWRDTALVIQALLYTT